MSSVAIPVASPAPRWWQRLRYVTEPLDFLEQAAQRSPDLFNAPVIGPHETVVLITHPEGIQQLFSNDQSIIAPPNGLLQPLVGDHSIFGLTGARHRRERKLLFPPFQQTAIPRYGALIGELTHQAMQTCAVGEPFLARSLAQSISLDVILGVVFGLSGGDRFEQLKQLIIDFTASFKNPLVSGALFLPALQRQGGGRLPWGKFIQLRRQISDCLFAEISDRQQQDTTGRTDILSLLLAARDEVGEAMTPAELHDELITLLLAGHETTASAIAWALYWVHRDPNIYQTLRAELTDADAPTDPLAIAKLPYLTAVCQETLRLYPIAILTVPREVVAPMTILGYDLAPGTRLYGAIYLTHHRPDLYPDSKTFRPERFLERQFSTYEFLPFGGGVRRCIGEVLALLELKLVVATLVASYDLEWVDTQPEVPKRRGVTLAPGNGVQLVRR